LFSTNENEISGDIYKIRKCRLKMRTVSALITLRATHFFQPPKKRFFVGIQQKEQQFFTDSSRLVFFLKALKL
jgi:hypothetical protein